MCAARHAGPPHDHDRGYSSADAALALQKLLIMEIYAPTPQIFTKNETSKACADMA